MPKGGNVLRVCLLFSLMVTSLTLEQANDEVSFFDELKAELEEEFAPDIVSLNETWTSFLQARDELNETASQKPWLTESIPGSGLFTFNVAGLLNFRSKVMEMVQQKSTYLAQKAELRQEMAAVLYNRSLSYFQAMQGNSTQEEGGNQTLDLIRKIFGLKSDSQSTSIASNAVDMDNEDTDAVVDKNEEDVDKNDGVVETNAEDVGINAEDVGMNAEDVNMNAEDVGMNVEDVGMNVEDVGMNAEDVGMNAEDVGMNAEDVDTNAEDVDTNSEDVGMNAEVKDVSGDSIIDSMLDPSQPQGKAVGSNPGGHAQDEAQAPTQTPKTTEKTTKYPWAKWRDWRSNPWMKSEAAKQRQTFIRNKIQRGIDKRQQWQQYASAKFAGRQARSTTDGQGKDDFLNDIKGELGSQFLPDIKSLNDTRNAFLQAKEEMALGASEKAWVKKSQWGLTTFDPQALMAFKSKIADMVALKNKYVAERANLKQEMLVALRDLMMNRLLDLAQSSGSVAAPESTTSEAVDAIVEQMVKTGQDDVTDDIWEGLPFANSLMLAASAPGSSSDPDRVSGGSEGSGSFAALIVLGVLAVVGSVLLVAGLAMKYTRRRSTYIHLT